MANKVKWIGVALLALAVALGFALRGLLAPAEPPPATATTPAGEAQVWTCSMHPQIRMDHPGKCPICGMDLIPLAPEETTTGDEAVLASDVLALGEHARFMAQVQTAPVERRLVWHELHTVGKVLVDETAVAYLTAWIDGRVDRVYADFPGTVVDRGDHLVQIYSPELYSTQQEYLTSVRAGIPQAVEASRRRLLLWGITAEQIQEIERTGAPRTHLTVFAPMGGTILEKGVRPGQYVKTGDPLYTIADLSRVWVVLEVYESELPWVRFGQPVELEVEGLPARRITGAVGFVEPVVTEATRTIRVRVMADNASGLLKPGMFVEASLRTPIDVGGVAGSTGLEGKWACPMHPMVIRDGPGNCPLCGMALEQVPGVAEPHRPVLVVPAEAVLTTGRRRLVFVEDRPARYRLVEPTLGARAGDVYPVLAGLSEGQRVVVRGNFLLDSQLQLSGRPSLLYPQGLQGGGGAHHHEEAPPAGAGHEGHGATPPPPTGHEGHAPPAAPPPPPSPPSTGGHGAHGGH